MESSPPSKIDWSPRNWPRRLYRFFTSFKLATVVLVFMTLVTLLGTLGQVEHGLHAAKQKYFHSWFFVEKIGGVPLLFPGGLLLMITLFVNMSLGAIVKVKKRWKGFGMLVSHIGMLMLLAGGFVTWAFSTDGYMALFPGMTSDRVESYREWQLEIVPLSKEGTAEKAWVYPAELLETTRPDEERVIHAESLPFDVVISGFSKNAAPIPTSAPMAAEVGGKEIDGFKLSPQKPSKEAEQNLPGCFLEIRPRDGGPRDGSGPVETILWAGSYKFDPREKPMPFVFTVGGRLYGALLAKRSWTVPFEVRLDEFIFERHPGVMTARNYESRVTRIEEGRPEKALEIKMNEPMRHAGYTFFQESFGPSGSQPGDEMFSQFAVANNPADQWPLWSLIVTGIGLALHFLAMLLSFVTRSFRNSATRPAAP